MLLRGQFTLKTNQTKSNNVRLKIKQKGREFALAGKRAQAPGAFAAAPCDRPSPARGRGLAAELFAHTHVTSQKCAPAKIDLFSSQKGNKIFHKRDLSPALVLLIGLGND